MIAIPQSLQNLIREIGESNISEQPILVTRFGRQFEQSFFGFTLPDDSNLCYSQSEYLSFFDSLTEAMNIQPEGYDPSNPSGGLNKEFFESVKSFLPSGKDDLKLFITIGTRMDFWHGADAVFCWKGVCVTMDATVDTNKLSKADADYFNENHISFGDKKVSKADILIRPSDVEIGQVYTSLSRKIVYLLLSRLRYQMERGFIRSL